MRTFLGGSVLSIGYFILRIVPYDIKLADLLTDNIWTNLFLLRTKLCTEFPLLKDTFDAEQTYKKNIWNHWQVCFTHSPLNALGYLLFKRGKKYFTNEIWKALYLSTYRLVKQSHILIQSSRITHTELLRGRYPHPIYIYCPLDFCHSFHTFKFRNFRWKPGYVIGISFSIYSILSLRCYGD